jgi:peptide/nickel transport system permease protein
MTGSRADERTLAELERRYGLDRPMAVQYGLYLRDLARGDRGRAWTTSNPVLEDIAQRFPATVELSLLALGASLLVALPLGIAAARDLAMRDRVDGYVHFNDHTVRFFYLRKLAADPGASGGR